MTPMALLMAHDTDSSTGTSTSAKCHLILLNNHLNIINAQVLFMCYIYMFICYCHVHDRNQKTPQMPCIGHTCQLVHIHVRHFCVRIYISYEPTAINRVNRNSSIHTFYIIGMSRKEYPCHTVHMWSTTLLL